MVGVREGEASGPLTCSHFTKFPCQQWQRAPLGGWAVGMGGSGYSSSSLACPTPEDMDPSPWSQKPGLLRVSYLPGTCQSSLGVLLHFTADKRPPVLVSHGDYLVPAAGRG